MKLGIKAEQQHDAELQIAAKFCKGVGSGGAEIYDMTKARQLFNAVLDRIGGLPPPTELVSEDGRPSLAHVSNEQVENVESHAGELNAVFFEGYIEHVVYELILAGINPDLAATLANALAQKVETRKLRVVW